MGMKVQRISGFPIPNQVMRDIKSESARTLQTVTAVVRRRLIAEYESRTGDSITEGRKGRATA